VTFATGWEKAEAEAVALKTQLDVALQQKLATEDRVAHLDGALKECMKQLRHVREEQEQRIHDTLVKKTREYDKLRAEMETKLAESSHFLAQTRNDLLESRAEVTALTHALQVWTLLTSLSLKPEKWGNFKNILKK
jgi:chromosome segregation ATPase